MNAEDRPGGAASDQRRRTVSDGEDGDRHTEARAFLAEYVPPDVAARVLERIVAHDEDLDESYRWASVTELVRELSEEPLDTIAWASLVSVRVDGPRGRALLAAISQHAAKADQLVGELQRFLARERAA